MFLNKCGYIIYHFNVHFSLMFLINDLLLAVYFIFILHYGNDVNSRNFLKFKMGPKAAETSLQHQQHI